MSLLWKSARLVLLLLLHWALFIVPESGKHINFTQLKHLTVTMQLAHSTQLKQHKSAKIHQLQQTELNQLKV